MEDSFGPLNIVAEFQNDSWRKLGKMTTARSFHKSIQINGKIFIVGGAGSKLSQYLLLQYIKYSCSSKIEIWENVGDDIDLNNQKLDVGDDGFITEESYNGEIIRIDGSECKETITT